MDAELLDDAALKTALQALSNKACTCAVGVCKSWESVPDERWPKELMTRIGTLRDPEIYEPTFEQYHPDGTNYDSPDAPISILHFPYNRCEAFNCKTCERVLLKYTEYGGYYVDHRVRWARVIPA
ncbi:MAG: hypothetical protein RIT15_1201 [Pseudomonadota bacterium]|jgi:hypothetical protein